MSTKYLGANGNGYTNRSWGNSISGKRQQGFFVAELARVPVPHPPVDFIAPRKSGDFRYGNPVFSFRHSAWERKYVIPQDRWAYPRETPCSPWPTTSGTLLGFTPGGTCCGGSDARCLVHACLAR